MTPNTKRRAAAGSEYALMLGLVAVLALIAVMAAGGRVNGLLARIGNSLCGASNGCGSTLPAPSNSSGGGGEGADTTPDAFSFAAVTDAAQDTLYTSNTLRITGMTAPAPITIGGNGNAQYRICADAGCASVTSPFGAAPGTIENLSYVTVRLSSSPTAQISRVATLTIGDTAGEFLVTTDNAGVDATVQNTEGGLYNVSFTLCGTGTLSNCTEAAAKASCTALGLKLVSHASDGNAEVLSLGASASCNGSTSYYTTTNTAFDDGTRCLVAPGNVDWSPSCCGTARWHGRTMHIGATSTPNWGIVNSNDSGRNAGYGNSAANTQVWGCHSESSPATLGSVTGCGASSFYVPCAPDNAASFSFQDQVEQPVGALIESNIVQITGTGASAGVNVTGPGAPQYRVCADAGCGSVVTPWRAGAGDIMIGQYLQVRQTTAPYPNLTQAATVTGGARTTKWSLRTILAADGMAKTASGAERGVIFTPCGTGTILNCTEAVAKASCTGLGLKLLAHAAVDSASMSSLGASNSCHSSISYFKTTSTAFDDGTRCLVGIGMADWTANCCANAARWHGRTLHIGPTSHPSWWGVVHVNDSGRNADYPNDTANSTSWGCINDTQAASSSDTTGCAANGYYVACTAP